MEATINQTEMQKSFFTVLIDRLEDGGIFIMSFILICGLVTLFLMGRSLLFVKNKNPKLDKMITLINSIGLFSLVLGVYGQLLQLINTLDYMEFSGGLQAIEFAAGLKFSILPTLFGCLIFLFSRFATIILNWLKPTDIQ